MYDPFTVYTITFWYCANNDNTVYQLYNELVIAM